MLSMRGSSSTTRTCAAALVVGAGFCVVQLEGALADFEGESEVAIGECGWATQPTSSTWTVLIEVFAALRLLGQIDRQVRVGRPARQRLAEQNLLYVVGQQDATRALPSGVVHDAALEALVDEVAV